MREHYTQTATRAVVRGRCTGSKTEEGHASRTPKRGEGELDRPVSLRTERPAWRSLRAPGYNTIIGDNCGWRNHRVVIHGCGLDRLVAST
jgi:hypothetical protein